MSTTDIGKTSEQTVSDYFKNNGYQIISHNWRTRWCEIDIISKKSKSIYFIEVKHRKNNNYGDGLDAITNKKIKQMTFAAELWVNEHNWDGDYQLMAVATSGWPPKIDCIVDL